MAKSTGKKLREQLVRRGKLDPASSRGSWNGVHPATKTDAKLVETKAKVLKNEDIKLKQDLR